MMEPNNIYYIDCIEGMKQLDNDSIDMILCDLPYGRTSCEWDSIIPLDLLWKQYKRIIKPNRAIVLTCIQPFTSMLIMSNQEMFKYEWIWEKSRALGFTHCKNKPMRKHENILVFSDGNIKHRGQLNRMIYEPQGLIPYGKIVNGVKDCDADKSGHRFARPSHKSYVQEFTNYPTSILKFNNEPNPVHPTQKPLELFKYLINSYSNERDLILDNCIGSGTTAVACKKLNRNFIGFENNLKYVMMANRRIGEEEA